MTDYWFAPLTALDPTEQTQDDRLRILFTLRRPPQKSPWPRYAVHLPRLVQHVGAVSSAHPRSALVAERLTTDFPGESFDALTLASPPLVELNPPQLASAVRLPKHRSPL